MNRWLTSTVEAYKQYFGVKESPIIYDVGSRDGRDCEELAMRISNGSILWENLVMVEANPPQQQVIKQNYPQATLIPYAISDRAGEVDFLQIKGNINMVGSSTMNTARNDKWIKETNTIKVQAKRLDTVIESLGHQNTEIDIIKIDVEGYSWETLESLGKYLRNVRVFHIETEIPSYARNKTTHDITIFMQEQGFKCVANDSEWAPEIIDLVWVRESV